jgi:predicted nucleic acid-binding protein
VSLVVVDTDVASTLTYGELTKWTLVRRWGPRSLDTMRTFLAALVVLPYDQRVATCWGEIQAYAQLRGRPRPTNDSWIAACCLVRKLPLATFNTKDYADFAEHEGLELVH